jgi:hypothetical protein
MAEWTYGFDKHYEQWIVRPPDTIVGAAFDTLQQAFEYFLMYRRMHEQA